MQTTATLLLINTKNLRTLEVLSQAAR